MGSYVMFIIVASLLFLRYQRAVKTKVIAEEVLHGHSNVTHGINKYCPTALLISMRYLYTVDDIEKWIVDEVERSGFHFHQPSK